VEVKKEGENKGKTFWACPQPQQNQCKFFQWTDPSMQQATENKWSKKRRLDGTNQPVVSPSTTEEQTRTIALNLLAERLTRLEGDYKVNHNQISEAIKEFRSEFQLAMEQLNSQFKQLVEVMTA
jgi:hypothetical protein